jgi:hypothetical protein
MRYCHNCRRYSEAYPAHCRYCSAPLEGRLCPHRHVNPVDRQLAFCGDCGQPLQLLTGAGFSLRPYLISLLIFAVTIVVAAFVAGALPIPGVSK